MGLPEGRREGADKQETSRSSYFEGGDSGRKRSSTSSHRGCIWRSDVCALTDDEISRVISALNGIPDRLKSQFLVVRDLGELATEIVKAVDDTRRLNVMQSNAFMLAEGTFNWDANGTKLLKTVESVANRRRAGSAVR